MKRILYTIIASVFMVLSANAQIDSTATASKTSKPVKPEKRYKKVYWGIKAGGGQMTWENDMNSYAAETAMPINGGLFIEYRPIKYIGIETGVNYFMASTEGQIEAYEKTIQSVDNEGDAVEYRFATNNFEETQELALLNVPIAIKLNAFAGNWEFFAKGGMEYRHALTATYEQYGRAANVAYYAQWDLTIDHLPSQGFYSDRAIRESGDINWKSGFDPFVGAGIVFPGRGTSFFIEGLYYLGGSGSTEQQATPFANRIGNIPFDQQQSGSIMEMGNSSLNGFIVNIGLRF